MRKGLILFGCTSMLFGGIGGNHFSGHLWEFVERQKIEIRKESLQKKIEKEVWRKQLGEEKYLVFYLEEKTREKRVALVDESDIGMIFMREIVERIEKEGLRIWEERCRR